MVNRVGDIGLALGAMLMFATFGTVAFAECLRARRRAPRDTTLNVLGLLLLLAACGKSAQVPLQSWLLDAMEGPTPVSALIHAATMVTAGVYLVVRSNFIYERTEVGQTAVVIVGVVTLLVGAIIGCAKDDIKKALAGSTMSQIGYMMLAAGLGVAGYAFAIFHLLTHGFFKANMFLGAGSVMHAMDDDVDMRHYGALQKALPVTFLTFAMGYLAIIGFPGFSGFWSKDKIIEAAFGESLVVGARRAARRRHHRVLHDPADDHDVLRREALGDDVHPHESPKVMTIPLIVLAALSVLGGLLLPRRLDHRLARAGRRARRSSTTLPLPPSGLHAHRRSRSSPSASRSPGDVGASATSRARPRRRSASPPGPPAPTCTATPSTRRCSCDRATPLVDVAGHASTTAVVDGVVDGTGRAAMGMSGAFRRLQTGYVRSYALSVLAGALHRRPRTPGGEPRMSDFPCADAQHRWCPLVGRRGVVIAACAQAGDGSALEPASRSSRSASRCSRSRVGAGGSSQFDTGAEGFQFEEVARAGSRRSARTTRSASTASASRWCC